MRTKKKIGKNQLLAMPLWLQSFYAFLRVLIIVGVIVALPRVPALITQNGSYVDLRQQLKIVGNIFLVSLGVPLHLFKEQAVIGPGVGDAAGFTGLGDGTENIPEEVSFVDQGNFSLIPLMTIIVVILLSRRSGYLLARAAPTRRTWQVPCGWFTCVAGVSALVSWLSGTQTIRASLGASAVIPLLPTGLGLWWGMKRKKGSWAGGPKSFRGALKVSGISTRRKGLTSWRKSIVKSSVITLSLLLCLSTTVLTIGFCLRWTDIARSFQLLDIGWAGDLEFFAVQVMYLPNVIIMAASWLSGAGTYFGNAALETPWSAGTDMVALIPVLHVVPDNLGWFGIAAPLSFVAAGFMVGRWFWLYAENYVDEIFDMFFDKRFISLILSSLVNALAIAALTAAVVLPLGFLGGGELGYPGAYYGAHMPWFGVYGAAALGAGIFIGQVATALVEYYQLRSAKAGGDAMVCLKKRDGFSSTQVQ